MVRRIAPAHDVNMHTTLELSDRDLALAASAHQLQRAAGAVQTQAANPDAVPAHELALAHVEETVDRLAVAMEQMANAVADWCGEPSAIVDENARPPRRARCGGTCSRPRTGYVPPRSPARAVATGRGACSLPREPETRR